LLPLVEIAVFLESDSHQSVAVANMVAFRSAAA
jgi:hypothetical protein